MRLHFVVETIDPVTTICWGSFHEFERGNHLRLLVNAVKNLCKIVC